MRTSSLHTSVLVAACEDELHKIAAATRERPRRKHKKEDGLFKKFLKNTALLSAGAGAGTGLAMLTERVSKDRFKNLKPSTKRKLVGTGLGLTGAATLLAAAHMRNKLKERE